jgi:hypothetical protein
MEIETESTWTEQERRALKQIYKLALRGDLPGTQTVMRSAAGTALYRKIEKADESVANVPR